MYFRTISHSFQIFPHIFPQKSTNFQDPRLNSASAWRHAMALAQAETAAACATASAPAAFDLQKSSGE